MKLFGLHKSIYQASRINGQEISPKALFRQKQVQLFLELLLLGRTSQEAAAALEISRATLFRWKKKMALAGVRGLEPGSTKPIHIRKAAWSTKLVQRIVALRKEYPAWGKDKLQVLLAREGIQASKSTVGRIIAHEIKHGRLERFVRRKVYWHKHIKQRRYAVRGPKGVKATRPGDIVQIDTMHLELANGKRVKQFTASCPVSRWSVVDVYPNATAGNAAQFLNKVINEMPFFIKAIQVDGGSEFMSAFEEACKGHQLLLYVLPPRSPKLNGSVERSNGTWRYEFYWAYDLPFNLEQLRQAVYHWQDIHNYVRPHQSLKGKTPYENMYTDEA